MQQCGNEHLQFGKRGKEPQHPHNPKQPQYGGKFQALHWQKANCHDDEVENIPPVPKIVEWPIAVANDLYDYLKAEDAEHNDVYEAKKALILIKDFIIGLDAYLNARQYDYCQNSLLEEGSIFKVGARF